MEKPTEPLEETHMAQAEKTASHAAAGTAQNGGTNVVTLGPRDTLNGRLDIQGDLRVNGYFECDLKDRRVAAGVPTVYCQDTIYSSTALYSSMIERLWRA